MNRKANSTRRIAKSGSKANLFTVSTFRASKIKLIMTSHGVNWLKNGELKKETEVS